MAGPAFKERETGETELTVVPKKVEAEKRLVRAEIRETTVQATVVAAATEKNA